MLYEKQTDRCKLRIQYYSYVNSAKIYPELTWVATQIQESQVKLERELNFTGEAMLYKMSHICKCSQSMSSKL